MGKKTLKPSEQAFVNDYLKNGYNATKAYLAIKPKSKYTSAKVMGARWLTRVDIKEAIQREMDKGGVTSVASRAYLIQEAHEVGREARGKGAYGAALKGTEIKAKLNHLFDDKPR